MKYLNLQSRTDQLNISKLILGTDYFGSSISYEDSFSMLDYFFEMGGNCVDTARVYAEWLEGGSGASETLIGSWIKSRKYRNQIIISTKGGHPNLKTMKVGRLSKECIISDLEKSLTTLNLDYIDLYLLHRDDLTRPVEDIMESLASIVKSGKVRFIGCSNWTIKRIEAANEYALQHGLPTFCTSQIQWSLARSTPEAHKDSTLVCMDDNEYEWYKENSFPVMAFSSQAKGFFAKAAALGLDNINQKAFERFKSPENIIRLKKVLEYSNEHKLTPSAVALGYLLCNKVPTMAILGCKSMDQLKDSLTSIDVNFSSEISDWLYKI